MLISQFVAASAANGPGSMLAAAPAGVVGAQANRGLRPLVPGDSGALVS
ncbi:MAG: hypothetical protein J2P29_04920 [Actinobacteria bacterium]|nr:hypothetical protein [Actinomycetota bacterium]